ncbi:protein-L-isoaspartate O-methyltransferase [Thiomicrospira aerophila AL3]|uniref:Protein-L-isoaspartate O-methyltransferase n=1 Tax=Thiomicrospira aerophila AL3 TaxID=717772 RepID=W0DTX2_9GAMM|nr:protein-L-isoaspartate O-methyltransferase [Thiomicrospira aerophila]AHF01897.1 protein-L-isoaspartate O-methyltransferase [Thiomicrospira aerophila AL3]
MNFDQARFFMIEQQIRPWDVLDPDVLALLEAHPRHLYVPEAQQKLAYSDLEIPIGEGEFMLSPKIEAKLLQAIDLAEQDRVLEVGTGIGYLTRLLSHAAASVTSIEWHPSLFEQAQTRLADCTNIKLHQGDASQNWPDGEQYDAIVITGALTEVSQAYREKLALGGRMVAFVGEAPAISAILITRISDEEWVEESLFETLVAPLHSQQARPRKFQF